MAQINFTGNLGADPTLKFTNSGNPVLEFRVADSKSKKLDNGKWETTAEQWLRVTVWGSYAEYLAEHLVKGTRVEVYGEFMSREYQDKDGNARTSLDVTAKGVHVVNKAKGNGNTGAYDPIANRQPQPATAGTWGDGTDNEPPF